MKHCPQCSTGYPDTLAACPTHGLPLNEIRDLKPGMVVHHSYRIVRKLGQGGMGAVYLAQHTLMDEPRALKFLSAELSQDAAFTARFLREVRTLRQIRHQNVVDCGDLESAEDGSLFFSMEFVDGPDLRAFLLDSSYRDSSDSIDCHPERSSSRTLRTAESKDPRLHSADESSRFVSGHDFSRAETPQTTDGVLTPAGALPVPLALALTRQIAAGLAAAHARGMVHRDIKPENILLARDPSGWQPKIADFGIVATKEASTAFTRTGGTLLTVAYAAPEQWRGTPAAQLDGRTDLYALGGLLYEMLTGQTPFHAESYEGWAQAHQTTPPPPPSALRPDLANWQGLDALVQRLLAKDREDRPKDVAELLNLLDMVQYVVPDERRETVKEVTGKSAEGKRSKLFSIWAWAVFVVVLLLLVIIAGRIFGTQPSKSPQETLAQKTPAAQSQPTEPKPEPNINLKPSDSKSIVQQEQVPHPVVIPGTALNLSTLQVICDLTCNWKLDGETKGRIDANGSAKVKVEPGQHVVIATTEDIADQVRQFCEIKANGQTVVSIELKPVRNARINAEQEARDKADREARDKAAREQVAREAQEKVVREQQEREQEQRKQQEREQKQREQTALTWTDPATGLMWAIKDNGNWVNWHQASDYCKNLQLAGRSGWRLATMDELKGIYDPNANVDGWINTWHVKGNLHLSGLEWSSSQGNASMAAWSFSFSTGKRVSGRLDFGFEERALCVRSSGK